MARQERIFRTRAVDLARQLPIVKDLDQLDVPVGHQRAVGRRDLSCKERLPHVHAHS